MTWQDTYGRVTGAFGIKGPHYGPQGHRGADYAKARRGPVTAYEHGHVVLRSYSEYIGYWLVVRNDDGTYSGWAHLVGESRLPVGTEVWGGTIVGLAAGSDDNPGDSWDGPHIHTTHGPTAEHVHTGTVWNPTTRINTALTAVAGGGFTPIEEDDMTPEQAKQLSELHAIVQNTHRSGYGHVLDEGDLGTVLAEVRAVRGAPHPTRNNYGRALDLGDMGEILRAIAVAVNPEVGDQATQDQLEQLGRQIIEELDGKLATSEDIAASETRLLSAIANVDEATLATFGLKRA